MIRKNSLVWVLCCLVLCFCSVSLNAGKLVFFVNGGSVGGSKMDSFSYDDNYEDLIFGYSVVESGMIANSFKKGAGFSGGVTYYIGPNLGLSLSLSHTKRDIRLEANYQTRVTLEGGIRLMDETAAWDDSGQLFITPLNFDVTYRLRLMKNLSINIMAGLSVMLYKLKLPSHIGFSGLSIIYYPKMDVFEFFPDYFDLDVSIERYASFQLGVNAGLELEQKLSSWLGISGGFLYFKTAEKEFRWELIRQKSFDGKLGNLIMGGVPEIFYGDTVVKKIDLSFYQVFIGIKIYL